MEFLASHPFLVFFFLLIILLVLIIAGKNYFDNWSQSSESDAIKSEADKFKAEFWGVTNPEQYEPTSQEKTALELREYYTISKRQAKRTFSSAMLACYLGFGMFGLAVVIEMFSDASGDGSGAQYSAIGGAVVEVIAGLFFWMYTKASNQMKTYYQSVLQTYRYEQAKELADQLNEPERTEAYGYIISQMAGGSADSELQLSSSSSENNENTEQSV